MPFHFRDEIADKLSAFADDGPDLSEETNIAKLLLQESVEHGNFSLACAILSQIPKIVTAGIANDIRLARLLPTTTVLEIARGISAIVCARLEAADIPNREAIMTDIYSDMQSAVCANKSATAVGV